MDPLDTLVTFDVAPDFTKWEVTMTRADAERLADTVATTGDPEHTVTFCNDCQSGDGVNCPHGRKFKVLAIGNLRLQPLAA